MALYKLKLPHMGEGVIEATLTGWLKEVGDRIEEDEAVFEVATDKVDSEVPSEVPGVLKEKLFKEGDVIKIGETVAIIETDAEIPEDDDDLDILGATAKEEEKPAAEEPAQTAEPTPVSKPQEGRFYSPLVRNIAKVEGITQEELDRIPGTGRNGRVTKDDILNYLKNRQATPAEKTAPTQASAAASPVASAPAGQPASGYVPQNKKIIIEPGDEIIEMDRMRKLIAQHMVESKHTSPHVQSFVEADVTRIVRWRNRIKEAFLKREGEKITFTPVFIYYLVKTIKDYPMINVQVDGDRIIRKKHINIGMAVALPSGNLIVPVIKDADQYNLLGLTKKVNDLARRARENKLQPDEVVGGTYSITNIGTFGNIAGTPIIPQPQVAIMAVGAIRKMPAVIETPEGDYIGIRHKMILSHSYDHRVVDGMLGGLFVKRFAEYLENFDENTEI
ncbi:MAG: 2-oxo acid dehydrogenase subunit E2 [Chlorobi bacterium]|nr:2-oxo acid dehydrogenase subunit E2 [Chlorobiota bacterium]